jgi:oligopeptide/dipeptide ABC transporter ATP-binding protein
VTETAHDTAGGTTGGAVGGPAGATAGAAAQGVEGPTASEESLLSVRDLCTYVFTAGGIVKAVDGVSFTLGPGEAMGLVGESGCGKSMTCHSIIRLLPPAARTVRGSILLDGEDLLAKSDAEMVAYRGKKIAMILQDPLMSLNPVYTVGNQVGEVFHLEDPRWNKEAVAGKVVDILKRVKIPSAERRLRNYPFEFSGGMRQRVVAAMAMARGPRLLIADEPTTALDVTIQDQFLRLLKDMQTESRMGLILVTHNLGIVAEVCHSVAIMYAGRIVESGTVERVYTEPAHPYTKGLMEALPKLGVRRRRLYQIEGEPPDLSRLPSGCHFHPRCAFAMDMCRAEYPPIAEVPAGGAAACWLLAEEARGS